MNSSQLLQLLESVAEGSQSPDSALEKLRTFQVENLGFAEVDHHSNSAMVFLKLSIVKAKPLNKLPRSLVP